MQEEEKGDKKEQREREREWMGMDHLHKKFPI